MAAALDSMAASLQGKLLSEQRFTADVAHELRTPLLVVTSESQASAVDLRTGKRVWQRADAAKGQAALAAGDLCFVASPTEFLWLAPKDGTVVHRVRFADGSPACRTSRWDGWRASPAP
ncbi:hypothetical protein SMICM17S_10950 [Streptomyces microflavus]